MARVGLPALAAGPFDRDVLLNHIRELLLVHLGAAHELMLEKFRRRRPLVGVLDQALRDEVGEKWRPLARDRRWLHAHNVQYDLTLTLFDVRRVPIRQLVSEDAQTPDVNLAVILSLALDKLGCHPADGADATRAMFSLAGQLRRVPEVRQLDVAIAIGQDIVTLDVSVDHVALVHRLQTEQTLPEHIFTSVLAVVRL